MILRTKNISWMLLAAVLTIVSCSREELRPEPVTDVPDGYVNVTFGIDVPMMQEVRTRAVDPDGAQGVQNLTLFCFDSYGLFISTVSAVLKNEGTPPFLSGRFTANIPKNTDRIHFLANQNMQSFTEDNFRSKSEPEVIATLEGSSGMMIYWGRFARTPGSQDINEDLKGQTIVLIRDQAGVTVDGENEAGYTVEGYAACNVPAFGTVAPYNPEFDKNDFNGFPSSEEFMGAAWNGIVTMPANTEKMTLPSDVSSHGGMSGEYIYETPNLASDPVSVIIKASRGGVSQYYRVMFVDEEGEQIPIRRNFNYVFHIDGELSYGQPTFSQALNAAATNNVWLSISDNVASVQDNEYILTVNQTNAIYEGKSIDQGSLERTLAYTLERVDGGPVTVADAAEVTWLDGNNAAANAINTSVSVSGGTLTGEITISLLPLGQDEKHEGTLMVKKGRLQRKIKVITVHEQEFDPVWITTQLDGTITAISTVDKSYITLMFSVPSTCPAELFPFNVLITVDGLDVRSESGMQLPLVFKGDPEYGDINDMDFGYKYVYTVTAPGDQRVFFRNVLKQDVGYKGKVIVEAKYFTTVTREYYYMDNRRRIRLNLDKYTDLPGGYASDEEIFLHLVPQKKGAFVDFEMELTDKNTDDLVDPNVDWVEFILYSKNLDYYREGDISWQECLYKDIAPDQADDNGRQFLFYPGTSHQGTARSGKYAINLQTMSPVSAEVVRLSSTEPGKDCLRHPGTKYADMEDGSHGYGYRSVIFDLLNYRPFRFFARVNGVGTEEAEGDVEAWKDWPVETIDMLEWTYLPSQEVDIEIDVTSFQSKADGNSVDPFGRQFDIYIDAPMLEIDDARLAECRLSPDKLKADPSVPGRFVYTVDSDRETERAFGTGSPIQPDPVCAVSREGERKKLPFRTSQSSVVTSGNIFISSDESEVVYLKKTFTVSNSPVTGTIVLDDGSGNVTAVPGGSFVSFARKSDSYRIGSMSITADGRFSLLLRKEYTFSWYTDSLELYYTSADNRVYRAEIASLAALYADPEIVLTLVD